MQINLKINHNPPISQIVIEIISNDKVANRIEIPADTFDLDSHKIYEPGSYQAIYDFLSESTKNHIIHSLNILEEKYPGISDALDSSRAHARILVYMIKNLARLQGLTQSDLSFKTGFQQGNIARMLAYKYDLTLSNYLKLANAIGLQVRFELPEHDQLMEKALKMALDQLTDKKNT